MSPLRAAAWLLALTLSWASWACAQVPVPALTGHVVDRTGVLSAEQSSTLEQTLQAFEARKGSQIAVLIIPTTAPQSIEDYGIHVAEQWKLGRKKIDDGAILLVAKDDHALRIEVGYGLEGALTDATSKRIISEIIVPRFRQGDVYGGVSAGVDQMIRVVDGEPLPEPNANRGDTVRLHQFLPVLVVLAVFAGGLSRAFLGRFPGAVVTGGAVGVVTWLLIGAVTVGLIAGVVALLFTLLSGGTGGFGMINTLGGPGRGGFGGGGFGSGSSGGGFSGGGGGFGGGGASGSW
jgi:uncharacterized protein